MWQMVEMLEMVAWKHPGQAHEGGEGEKGGKKAPKNAPKDSTLLHLIMGNLIRGSWANKAAHYPIHTLGTLGKKYI